LDDEEQLSFCFSSWMDGVYPWGLEISYSTFLEAQYTNVWITGLRRLFTYDTESLYSRMTAIKSNSEEDSMSCQLCAAPGSLLARLPELMFSAI